MLVNPSQKFYIYGTESGLGCLVSETQDTVPYV